MLFKAIENDIVMLCKHRFGNYVIQKIVERGIMNYIYNKKGVTK